MSGIGLQTRIPAPEEPKSERHIGSPPPTSGKTVAELDEEYRQAQLGQIVTVRCWDCPDLEWTGPQAEMRIEWAKHRRDAHGEDEAVARVEASLAGLGRRRTSGGRVSISQNVNKLEENLAKTRLAGGGHGVAQTNGQKARTGADPWSREEAIAAIQAFVREHGRAPTSTEWKSSTGLPSYVTARKLFGTTEIAIAAAAGPPVPPPVAESDGQPEGQPEAPIEPEPAPAQASEGTPERTLVELAKRVEELDARCSDLRAVIADLEHQHTQAVTELATAVALIAVVEAT